MGVSTYIYDCLLNILKKFDKPILVNTSKKLTLFLIWLKHYPSDSLVSFIGNIPRKTWNDIKFKLLNIFFCQLKQSMTLGDQYERMEESEKLFGCYATLVVDGFEREVVESNHKIVELLCYSSKKHQHSLNRLIFVSPKTKKISFMGNTFGGSDNDGVIAGEEVPKVMNKLRHDEICIGDEAFQGLEHVRTYSINNSQTHHEARYIFNQFRVLVENAIADIKKWNCIKRPMRKYLSDVTSFEIAKEEHNKVLLIVSVIENWKKDFNTN